MASDQEQRAIARVAAVWDEITKMVYQGKPLALVRDLLDLSEMDLETYFLAHPERRQEYLMIRNNRPKADSRSENQRRRRAMQEEDDAYAFELFIKAFANGISMADSIKESGIRNAPHLYTIMEADPTGLRRQQYEDARRASLFVLEDRIEQIAMHGATRTKLVSRYDEDGNKVPVEIHETRGDDTRALLALLRRRDPANWNDRLVSNVGTMIAKEQLDPSRLSDDELEAYLKMTEKMRVVDVSAAPQLPSGEDEDEE